VVITDYLAPIGAFLRLEGMLMKSPAFQMYAADIYMDTNEWSAEAFGIYNRLLNHQWVNGSIPKDIKTLAQISFIGIKTMSKRWPEMASKFEFDETNRGRNKRLEETRQKQIQYIEKQREKGKVRAGKMWDGHIAAATTSAKKRLQPNVQPKDSPSSSSSTSSNNKTIISKIVFEDGNFKTIPDALMNKWREVAPGINIPAELKKAELWLLANPEKRRSRWGAFLSTWMVRAQDNFIKYGGSNGGIRTARSDRDDKTLQSRTDAEVDAILRRRDLAKKSTGNQAGGNAGNDDAPDFQGITE
jgi:uncharacterized protein YdaU (DUF1376 family)